MDDLITYDVDGQTALLTLNRPEKRNALSYELVLEFRRALLEAERDPDVRCVVVTGVGNTFSAGADLGSLQTLLQASPMDNVADSENLAALFEHIYTLRKPVIAMVNGHAIGGGCGLAAVCDFSIATEHARLGFTEVRIGFVPAIVSVFVLRKLGETATRDLLLRGTLISAQEAAAIGLITRAVPKEKLDGVVQDLVQELASETSASAVYLTKRLLSTIGGMGLKESLAHAVQVNAFARGTDDCRAGIEAFLSKTDPPWKKKSGRNQQELEGG